MNRIAYLDRVKGIGIILMVIGHAYSHEGVHLVQWLYSFHMPLFFIVSGILYANKTLPVALNFTHKIKTLLLPYYLWNGTYQLFLTFLGVIGGFPLKETFLRNLKLVIMFSGSAMWFLPVMFLSTILLIVTMRSRRLSIVCMSVAFVIVFTVKVNDGLLQIIIKALLGYCFMVLGYYASPLLTKKQSARMTAAILVVAILLSFTNGTVSMASLCFNNILLYVINSVLGTFAMICLSRLEWPKQLVGFVEQCGKDSVIILCLHGFIIQTLRIIDYKMFGNVLPRLGVFEGLVFTAIILFIIEMSLPLIRKYFSWSFGRHYKELKTEEVVQR